MGTRMMKALRRALVAMVMGLPLLVWASKVDSLLSVLAQSKEDTNKVNTLIALASAELKHSPNKSLEYSKQAMDLAVALEFKVGESRALGKSGLAYKSMGQYVQAVEAFSKAAEMDRSLGRKRAMAGNLGNTGHVYHEQGMYVEALEYYEKVHGIFLELKDTMNLAASINSMGSVKQDQGDFTAAMEKFLEAKRLFEQLKDSGGIAMTLHNVGIIRFQTGKKEDALKDFMAAKAMNEAGGNPVWLVNNLMAIVEVLIAMDDAEKALPYLSQAAEVAKSHDDFYSLGLVYDEMGKVHEKLGSPKQAQEDYLQALEIREKIMDRKGIANSRLNLGILYNAQGNTAEGMRQFRQAEEIFRSIGAKEELADTYRAQSEAHAKAGRYQDAWENERKYANLQDSMLQAEMQEVTGRMETASNLKTIQQALRVEQAENALLASQLSENRAKFNLLLTIGVMGFLLLVVVLMLFIQRRQLTVRLELQNEDISRKLREKEQLLDEVMVARENRPLPEAFKALSTREMEVVYYLSTGLKDKDIAEALFVSVPTIKTHLARIYRKLEVKNRAEVVALVHQNAIFESSSEIRVQKAEL